MKPKGLTLVEIIVALGLMVVVGGAAITLMARTETSGRTTEGSQAATLLLKTMVESMTKAAPSWLPNPGETKTLNASEIQSLLQSGQTSYTDPNLYTATVTRSSQPDANGRYLYTFEVCIKPGGQNLCYRQDLYYAPISARHLEPPPGEGDTYSPPPGNAYIQVVVDGDSPGAAQVSLTGPGNFARSYIRYGTYNESAPPGAFTLAAYEARDGRYSYTPSPANQNANVGAGFSKTFSVNYTCATGAADITVVPPSGVTLSPGTVTLASQDVTRGGLVPYLAPGTYTLQARTVTSGGYTYQPEYSPGQNLSVQACQSTAATVSYEPITGRLQVNISAPSGVTPNVKVQGPDATMPQILTTSRTLDNLSPGTYTLTPNDVLVNGVRYRGTANPTQPAVQAGQTATAQVTYSAVSARLTLNITGPQGAAAPSVKVIHPSSQQTQISRYGTTNLDDLAPGDYRIQASTVSDRLYTYAPSPASTTATLAAGDRKTVNVAYAASTGALTVQVNGLPTGASPSVVKVDGTSLSQNPQTFPYLAPGSHTVTADNVTGQDGFVYAPDAASRTVQVQAGQTAQVQVNYTRLQGVVDIRVQGLPDSSQASWTLTTPTSSVAGSGPRTLSGMPTGTYSLTARSVTLGGIRYDPSVSPTSGTLSNGGTLTFTISYTAVTGNLDLTVNGLTDGAQITVARQGGGYSATVTRSTLLTGLPPGTYQITAQDATRQESTSYGTLTYTYKPDPASQTASVQAGQTATASVAYTRQQGNVSIAVQNLPSASATIRISGPGGFSRVETLSGPGNRTLSYASVPTGTYQVQGDDIRAGGYTYKASPVSGTLNHGATLSLTLSYAPADGKLTVTATGLPAGAPMPTLTVKNSAGQVVASVRDVQLRLTNLLPGTYTVSASDVVLNGFTWKAQGSPATASVVAGQEAAVSFTYVEQAAYIRIYAPDLPSGATATGTVTGGNFSQTYSVTASQPATVKVPLGTYTVTAQQVTYGGYDYIPYPSSQQVNAMLPGSLYPITFNYSEASGSVSINVSGLPGTASANLTLTRNSSSQTKACPNGTCTFSRLPLGTYTASASDYKGSLYTYRATLSPTSYTLTQSGQTLTGSATYAPIDGALVINVSGPSGMPSPTVRVYRSSTLVATFNGTGTHTLAWLPPGTYLVVPERVDTSTGYYSAPQASASVQVGQTATVNVSYTFIPTVGNLSLTVSGLPNGVSASITIRARGGSYNQTVNLPNGSYTYNSLAPDTYDILPQPVSTPSGNYVASSTSATVVAGGTATARVTYSLERATLTLSVSGLPSGATAALTVIRQGGGYSSTQYLGNGSRSLTVPTGTYSISAAQVSYNGQVYLPNPSSQTISVGSGGATASVAYFRGTGSLKISVSGVPSGRSATIRVSGPSGYSTSFSSGNTTTTLSPLDPGTYTAQAGGIWISSFFFFWKTIACPSPQSASANVTAGGTATISFSYYTLTYWLWQNPCPIF